MPTTTFRFSLLGAVFVLGASTAELPVIPGDSTRGAKLFQTQQCVHCHAVNGVGGKVGIDLGRMVSRKYTPALLTFTMWNHGPVMWGAMDAAHIETPRLSPEDAADLFAFFYSARFFDQPGDASRGQQTFTSRQCVVCHGIEDSRAEGAPPVARWESLSDPVVLVRQMWNHSYRMHDAFARRKIEWQALTTAELDDILAYLSSLPRQKSSLGIFRTPAVSAANRCSSRRAASIAIKGRWRWKIASTT